MQPLFQQRGYAPIMYIRPGLEDDPSIPFQPMTVNDEAQFCVLLLARPLLLPGERRGLTEQEIDAFISLCSEVSGVLDEAINPRSWFQKRRSASQVSQNVALPIFDKTRDRAINLAWQYSSLLDNLPNYRKLVRVTVKGTEPRIDEIEDFLEFVGFDPNPVSEGLWYEGSVCATFQLQGSMAWLSLPHVARTPEPLVAYDNLKDAAKRLAMEFGGEVLDDDQNTQVIRGWTNLLGRVKLSPGDEEARELFPIKV